MEALTQSLTLRIYRNRVKPSINSLIVSKIASSILLAMASIAASAEAEKNAMRLRERELAAVKINAADVDIIANELELNKKVAERTLREHKGDAVAAIRSLLH
ncbi:hypothetical protein ES319_D02G069000v1 [Gossypium barbadense]|uniref:Nascent polypeptide-associated complex subunit alpha-like UBA domain-containing protein n=2 Tax=Gossypium TaxID=3633 RepID=A0A5J5S9X1_GOSBA|nr:hypothetical protein ES319_D02G069000v1 [Gossypium barbadense]TYG78613.1 hypothetical protein ES288_D02G073900v1 [Gossypium darwinii]